MWLETLAHAAKQRIEQQRLAAVAASAAAQLFTGPIETPRESIEVPDGEEAAIQTVDDHPRPILRPEPWWHTTIDEAELNRRAEAERDRLNRRAEAERDWRERLNRRAEAERDRRAEAPADPASKLEWILQLVIEAGLLDDRGRQACLKNVKPAGRFPPEHFIKMWTERLKHIGILV